MVTSEIFQNVLFVKNGDHTGTCFYTGIEKKVYLITARHLFSDSIVSDSKVAIEIWQNNRWDKIEGNLLLHNNREIDIALIDINQSDENEMPYDLTVKGMSLSQECFFLGFPYNYKMDVKPELNNGRPIPFIKKGIISAWNVDNSGTFKIFLDGHNNPGFSGGPVVIANLNSKKFSVIGIISSYIAQNNVVNTPFGQMSFNENSGIVNVYAIKHVFEILAKR